jgi:uncharacterized membrane protein YeaQ/YmgE (transglycosylase-associated protein family)
MAISFAQGLMWLLLAAVVGVVGELLARRRAPDGIVGAIMGGLLAMVLMMGVFPFHLTGEPKLEHVQLISSGSVAAILVAIWSGFAYRRVQPSYAGYSRRGGYARRPRRRWF